MSSVDKNPEVKIYAPAHFKATWKKFQEICERDGTSASQELRVWVEGYVQRKDPGNPQRPLTAYAPGHKDELALHEQEAFRRLQAYAEEHHGEISWLRVVEELKGDLSGQARVDAAEKMARRLTKAGVRVTR